jgi:hypothetical protein
LVLRWLKRREPPLSHNGWEDRPEYHDSDEHGEQRLIDFPGVEAVEGGDGAEGEHDAGIKPMMRNDLRPNEPPDKA